MATTIGHPEFPVHQKDVGLHAAKSLRESVEERAVVEVVVVGVGAGKRWRFRRRGGLGEKSGEKEGEESVGHGAKGGPVSNTGGEAKSRTGRIRLCAVAESLKHGIGREVKAGRITRALFPESRFPRQREDL